MHLSSQLSLRSTSQKLTLQRERLDHLSKQLNSSHRQRVEKTRQQLNSAGRQLDILSYRATLDRGYAVVRSGAQLITNTTDAKNAAALTIEFADGAVNLGPVAD